MKNFDNFRAITSILSPRLPFDEGLFYNFRTKTSIFTQNFVFRRFFGDDRVILTTIMRFSKVFRHISEENIDFHTKIALFDSFSTIFDTYNAFFRRFPDNFPAITLNMEIAIFDSFSIGFQKQLRFRHQ